MSKLLLIGPCQNKKDPSKTGGVIVLFEDLLVQMKNRDLDFMVIDTNKANYSNILIAIIFIYLKIFIYFFSCKHISIHGTAKDYLFIAPFVIFLSKIFGKKTSTRKFAGNFNTFYENSQSWKKKLIEYVLKNSTYNFFETKYLVDFFKKFNKNTYLFPNVRKKLELETKSNFSKKFVFISQLFRTKGVHEILEASNKLDKSYQIDLYGPLRDDYTLDYFDNYRANYKGSLKANEVLKTLNEYDVLTLASYYPGEGYPGVIIEALSLGKPVIVTDLESIKEMVDESCAIFVKPKCSGSIVESIKKFNEDNYKKYSFSALKYFDKFDSDIQTNIFLEIIFEKTVL